MRSGCSLDDADRMPWLQAVARWIDERLSALKPGIITCSNLKRAYRQITIGTRQGVRLVFLKHDEHVIHARNVQCQHRYMPSTLLRRRSNEPGFAGWSGDFGRTCGGSGLKVSSLWGIEWGGNGGPVG